MQEEDSGEDEESSGFLNFLGKAASALVTGIDKTADILGKAADAMEKANERQQRAIDREMRRRGM